MEVAKLIVKELAKEKGLILKDLAERLKINRVTLSNMINGNPTLESLQKIAYALDVPVYKLFQIQEHILKVINNGKVVVRIFSTETIVSLIELGSVVRILEKFRNYYLNYAPVGRVNQKIFHNEYSRN